MNERVMVQEGLELSIWTSTKGSVVSVLSELLLVDSPVDLRFNVY